MWLHYHRHHHHHHHIRLLKKSDIPQQPDIRYMNKRHGQHAQHGHQDRLKAISCNYTTLVKLNLYGFLNSRILRFFK